MILAINTIAENSKEIILSLSEKEKKTVIKRSGAKHKQSEKLLPAINSLLSKQDAGLHDITRIVCVNQGGSFTSLRIGIITANALGYALGVPVYPEGNRKPQSGSAKQEAYSLVKPEYGSSPNITIAKSIF